MIKRFFVAVTFTHSRLRLLNRRIRLLGLEPLLVYKHWRFLVSFQRKCFSKSVKRENGALENQECILEPPSK